jgi:hypothetical protein
VVRPDKRHVCPVNLALWAKKHEVVVAYAPTNLGYDLKIAIKVIVIESSN